MLIVRTKSRVIWDQNPGLIYENGDEVKRFPSPEETYYYDGKYLGQDNQPEIIPLIQEVVNQRQQQFQQQQFQQQQFQQQQLQLQQAQQEYQQQQLQQPSNLVIESRWKSDTIESMTDGKSNRTFNRLIHKIGGLLAGFELNQSDKVPIDISNENKSNFGVRNGKEHNQLFKAARYKRQAEGEGKFIVSKSLIMIIVK